MMQMKDVQPEMQSELIVKANADTVRFFGRTVNNLKEDMVFFNWTASGFEFQFTGTSVYAELITDIRQEGKIAQPNSRAHIGVFIDNKPEAVSKFLLDEERKWYPLAKNLSNGTHTVKVIKLSEVGYGRAAVANLKVIGTKIPEPTSAKNRRIEFIGDSITCGYGNECTNKSSEFDTWEENGARNFGSMTATELKAEANFVSVSGTGAYHDYGMNTHNLVPELYYYTDKMLYDHYGKEPEAWDFNQYVPDVIILKLGQNDSRFCDGWDKPEEERTEELKKERRAAFIIKYKEFLRKIRNANPNSLFLVLYEENEGILILKKEILEAVHQYQEETKDNHIYLKEVDSWQLEEGIGANGHWSVCTHRRVANTLIDTISSLTGWNVNS